MDWSALREEFPVTKEDIIFFNHAGVSPLPRYVVKGITDYLERVVRGDFSKDMDIMEETRAKIAELINADEDEIAFVKNTSSGIILAADSIDWRSGDNVVTVEGEFPANVYPWLSKEQIGVKTKFVSRRNGRISVEDLEKAIDDRTRVLALSFVQFTNGFRSDMKTIGKMCRERGVLFVVDAIQGLGALNFDVKEFSVDMMASGGHKWLMSHSSLGCFYCSKEILDDLVPANIGWNSVADYDNYLKYDLTLRPTARRFEEGSPNVVGTSGLSASLDMIFKLGIENIEKRIIYLTDLLISKLKGKGYKIISSLKPEERSGIVNFNSDKHSVDEIIEILKERKIVVRKRESGIRVSPHFYNSEGDIERLISALP